ncbi:hypothetical protein [Lacrimispora sp. 38-1]|uniref:hypothetical protein n=1 Tax=Lacrimispora sp. 38-1 TaxID=3125778 RepID=UPI003CE73250
MRGTDREYMELYTAFRIAMYTNEQLMNLVDFLLAEIEKEYKPQSLTFEQLMFGE